MSLNESGEEDDEDRESVASGDEGYEGDTSDNDSDGYGTDTTITNEPQSSDGWSELRHEQERSKSNQSTSEEHSEITNATVHSPKGRRHKKTRFDDSDEVANSDSVDDSSTNSQSKTGTTQDSSESNKSETQEETTDRERSVADTSESQEAQTSDRSRSSGYT